MTRNGHPLVEGHSGSNLGGHLRGEVSELADEHDLGSCAARRRGSSPLFPIQSRRGARPGEHIVGIRGYEHFFMG